MIWDCSFRSLQCRDTTWHKHKVPGCWSIDIHRYPWPKSLWAHICSWDIWAPSNIHWERCWDANGPGSIQVVLLAAPSLQEILNLIVPMRYDGHKRCCLKRKQQGFLGSLKHLDVSHTGIWAWRIFINVDPSKQNARNQMCSVGTAIRRWRFFLKLVTWESCWTESFNEWIVLRVCPLKNLGVPSNNMVQFGSAMKCYEVLFFFEAITALHSTSWIMIAITITALW